MKVKRRLERLEQKRSDARQRFRVVVCAIGRSLNLANSTCKRTLAEDGLLTEVVRLDGSRDDLTDEELDRFVASFPLQVETNKPR